MWNWAQNDCKLCCFQCTNDTSLPSHSPGATEVYGFFFPRTGLGPDRRSSVLYFSPLEGAHIWHKDLSRWQEKVQSPLSSAASPLDTSVNAGRLDARSSPTHPKSSVCPTHLRASCDVFLGSQSREYSQQCCSVNTHFMEKTWETLSFVGNFSWIIFV